jgi:hypothetical protein
LCLRSDDVNEAWRLGGVLQVVRVQSDSGLHGRARNRRGGRYGRR